MKYAELCHTIEQICKISYRIFPNNQNFTNCDVEIVGYQDIIPFDDIIENIKNDFTIKIEEDDNVETVYDWNETIKLIKNGKFKKEIKNSYTTNWGEYYEEISYYTETYEGINFEHEEFEVIGYKKITDFESYLNDSLADSGYSEEAIIYLYDKHTSVVYRVLIHNYTVHGATAYETPSIYIEKYEIDECFEGIKEIDEECNIIKILIS